MQVIVTILVNKNDTVQSSQSTIPGLETLMQDSDELLTVIKSFEERIISIPAELFESASREVLRYLYEKNKVLVLKGEGYELTLQGQDFLILKIS